MKAGDVYAGHTSSRESWLSARLGDPNAALWASITPPANPNLATIVRRRAAAFSLDLLAQHLYLRFPAHLSSRSTARTVILAATVALGAALGTAGYLALGPERPQTVAHGAASAASAAQAPAAAPSVAARAGETVLAVAAPSPALTTTARSNTTEQIARPLLPTADATDPKIAPPKAKPATANKKRSKASVRRSSKRRARATAH
jgi:hypothetical protein